MLISELKDKYPKVYEAAIKERGTNKAQAWRGAYAFGCNVDLLDEAFDWSESPQGDLFWEEINEGCFDAAKEICPELFEKTINLTGVRAGEEYCFGSGVRKGTSWFKQANETVLSFERGEDVRPYQTNNFGKTYKMVMNGQIEKYEYIQINIMQDVLSSLNDLGKDGWQLVAKEAHQYTFMRNKQ